MDDIDDRTTNCQCNFGEGKGGYCESHCIKKTPHFYKLCRFHQSYKNSWDKGYGPNSELSDCKEEKKAETCCTAQPTPQTVENSQPTPTPEPTLFQKAVNLGGAVVQEAATRIVSGNPEAGMAERRMAICEQCPLLIKPQYTCDPRQGGCGCNMRAKVHFRSQVCPKGKWGAE